MVEWSLVPIPQTISILASPRMVSPESIKNWRARSFCWNFALQAVVRRVLARGIHFWESTVIRSPSLLHSAGDAVSNIFEASSFLCANSAFWYWRNCSTWAYFRLSIKISTLAKFDSGEAAEKNTVTSSTFLLLFLLLLGPCFLLCLPLLHLCPSCIACPEPCASSWLQLSSGWVIVSFSWLSPISSASVRNCSSQSKHRLRWTGSSSPSWHLQGSPGRACQSAGCLQN